MTKRTLLRSCLALALLIVLIGQFVGIPPRFNTAEAATVPNGTIAIVSGNLSGPAGSAVQLQGGVGAFAPNTSIVFSFSDFNNQVTTANVCAAINSSADGSFGPINCTIPTIAAIGVGYLRATGTQPNVTPPTTPRTDWLLSTPFQVTATTASITPQPQSLTTGVGTLFVLSGSGFAPNSTVTVNYSVNGGGFTFLSTLVATAQGTFSNAIVSNNFILSAGANTLTIQAKDNSAAQTTATYNNFTINNNGTANGLTITPTSQQPGGIVTVMAAPSIFPGSQNNITLQFIDSNNNPTYTYPNTVTAGTDGSLNIQITLPAQAAAGTARIIATAPGRNPNTGNVTISSILCTPSCPSQSYTIVPGQTITVAGSGYAVNSFLTIQVNGVNVVSGNTLSTNSTGSFSTNITIPTSVSLGAVNILAQDSSGGLSQGNQRQISLTVTAATATSTATLTPTFSPTLTPSATMTPTASTTPILATWTPVATAAPATSAYFAEGYTGLASTNGKATFTEVLNLLNPTSSPALATITYYIQGASTQTVTRAIPANSVIRESVNTDVGPDKIVAVQVTSPQRISVTRTMTRVTTTGTRLDGSTTQAVAAPATNWYFPEGYTGISFQEYLTILNPSSTTSANVSVVLAPQASSSAGARTLNLVVPPLSRTTANIRSLNTSNSAQSIGMMLSSSVPIVAERVLYFSDGSGSGKFGSTVSRGLTTAATQLRIGYATSGGMAGTQAQGDQAFITLLNPNAGGGPVQVTATFADASGRTLGSGSTVSVAPGTRQTIAVNAAVGAAAAGPISIALSANGAILAEIAQYYGGSPNSGSHPGVDYPAFSGAMTDALMSDLSTQSADGAALKRTVYLYNPGTAPITVSGSYFGSGGQTAHGTYTVPAGGVTSVNVNQDTVASIPAGAVGAQFTSSGGGFIAASSAISADNLSATEDIGN